MVNTLQTILDKSHGVGDSPATATVAAVRVWDESTQQYHGGQEWAHLPTFHEDFSVTTNGLGTPKGPLLAARAALDICHHYPPADQEPSKTKLATFLAGDAGHADHAAVDNLHARLLLGNGASELIDLVTRLAPPGKWRGGPSSIQYKEYERAAIALDRAVLPPPPAERDGDDGVAKARAAGPDPDTAVMAIVNPNNPTGDYMAIAVLKAYIEKHARDDSVVIVDESMQLWYGPTWRDDSLVRQTAWIADLYATRRIAVYIMHSWTKIWSCTGLRLGSMLCPTAEHARTFKRVQVPWSVNVPGLAFLEAAVSPEEQPFLDETWAKTSGWGAYLRERFERLRAHVGPSAATWTLHGEAFLSWVWIDFKDARVAEHVCGLARAAGTPVRPGANGYNRPTCARLAVRPKDVTDILFDALERGL
ncbi:PLP-dependent transferase [Caulochytrium protostelioides]|uniref:PLP-dependent transferase n=1 Tax=Caulochytrium protostelioides TaxID=1555241 RepID=A0A4V1ITQ1_9FUNG|nr:PLP-dependent transferase [Caulochytrium protostelioides]